MKIIARSHYWQSATSCSLQFCFADWKQQAQTQEFGPHNSGIELAEVVQMLCLLQGACWNEFALQRWLASILGSRLGKSIWLHFPGWPDCCPAALRYPRRFLRHYTCNIQWSKVCCVRCWTYVRTGRNILAYHKDVHYHLSWSQSWWPCSSLTRRLNLQWKLKPGNPVSFLSMNWFMLTIHWWLPRTLVEQKHIWDALKQWEWIMAFASTGRNARYCLLGAKLPSQPLTEVTLHANHPSHIWEVIWMPLVLVAPKSAGDWVKPKVNSTNWQESGGILPCTPNKRSVSSKLVSCQSCCIACTQCGWIRRNYGKLMGFKQSASVLSFISHCMRAYFLVRCFFFKGCSMW